MICKKSKLSESVRVSLGSEGFDKAPDWTLSHYIPSQGVGCLYAPAYSLKTFVMTDIAASITAGIAWAGNRTSQGNVIYVAAEGGNDLSKRVKAWELHNQLDVGSKLLIVKEPISPVNYNDSEWLLIAAKEHEKLTGLQTKLIIFDTLSQCAKNLEENSAKDMSEFIRACNKLSEKLLAPVLFVHHAGKNGGFRGSSVIECNTDFVFKMKRLQGTLSATLSVCKQKDFEESPPVKIELGIQDLGFSYDDGEAVTSLVVTSKSSDTNKKAPIKAKLSQSELTAQKLHERAIAMMPAINIKVDDLVDGCNFSSRQQKKRALDILIKYPNVSTSPDNSFVTVTPHTKDMGGYGYKD